MEELKLNKEGQHIKEMEEAEKIIERASKEENKTDKNEEHSKNKNKKTAIMVIVAIILLLLALIFSTIFALLNITNSNIVSGVKIEGIDVSGLTKEQAKEKMELIYNEKKDKDIDLKYEDYETAVNPELIEANFEVEQAIEEAEAVGRESNIFVNNYNIIIALIGKKDINVNVTINEEAAKKTIEDIGTNLPGSAVEPDYSVQEDNLIITKGKKGIAIDSEKLLNKIKEILNRITNKEELIEIPVTEKIPEEININSIHEEIHKEVQDAYYTKEPFTIHPEVEGVDFNVDEAKAIIEAEDKEEYTIKLTITKPKVTTADIGSEAFPDLLATFTTNYDASNKDRTTNLRLACQKLNDKVVLAGATFSYNQTLGERTTAAGYKNAKVYENGEVVDGIGGGICQISSTLYNAVLISNMDIVERRNHQFVTSYLPAGRDATVVYGLTDFKFKNTRTYAVKIKASVSNGIATISIYGIKDENEYKTSFETKTISTIPYTVKYVDDTTLNVGTEKVKQKGANGLITETYMIKSLNGKVVSRKLLSKDTYSAMQRIILRGTNGSKTTQTQVTTPQVTTPTVTNSTTTEKTNTSSGTEQNKKEENSNTLTNKNQTKNS